MPNDSSISANNIHQTNALSDGDLILVVTDPTANTWKLQAITLANLRSILANT